MANLTAPTNIKVFHDPTMVILDPSVRTLSSADVTVSSVLLRGELTKLGVYEEVEVYFEWGLSPEYGSITPSQTLVDTEDFSFPLSGLESWATYYYRAAVTDGEEVWYGSEESVTLPINIEISHCGVDSVSVHGETNFNSFLRAEVFLLSKFSGSVRILEVRDSVHKGELQLSKYDAVNFLTAVPLSSVFELSHTSNLRAIESVSTDHNVYSVLNTQQALDFLSVLGLSSDYIVLGSLVGRSNTSFTVRSEANVFTIELGLVENAYVKLQAPGSLAVLVKSKGTQEFSDKSQGFTRLIL